MEKQIIERLFKRHSISELAKKVGVSERTVQGWKYGRKPSPILRAWLERIAATK